jgi:hypothetical protein
MLTEQPLRVYQQLVKHLQCLQKHSQINCLMKLSILLNNYPLLSQPIPGKFKAYLFRFGFNFSLSIQTLITL